MTAAFMATQAQIPRDVKWLYPIQINDGSSTTHTYNIPYNNNALIDMESKTKGLLIPRLALVAANNPAPLSVHVKGMLVYDTVTSGTTPYNVAPGFYYNDGTQRVRLIAVTDTASTRTAWMTNGNAGTNSANNFIGTTDKMDLIFKVNNVRAGLLDSVHSNTSFGVNALNPANTTGFSNTALGINALAANTTGLQNTAVGSSTLMRETTGSNNSAFGQNALMNLTTGTWNTAFGAASSSALTTATQNTAYGTLSLTNDTTGSNNTAVGVYALNNLTSGNNNTAIGNRAGFSQTSGDNNIMIGYNANIPNPTGSNQLNIGNALYGINAAAAAGGSVKYAFVLEYLICLVWFK